MRTSTERATCYCALIRKAQERMDEGAAMAFTRNPNQRAACARMLVYVAMIRWLYLRALHADGWVTLAFRQGLVGKPWPYGGIDDADIPFFRLMASGEFESVDPAAYPWPA